MALPDSVQAARARRDMRAAGYRPTIKGARYGVGGDGPDPFAGLPSLTERTTQRGISAPDSTSASTAATPVDPFAGQGSLTERTTPDNLGGKLPFNTQQKQDISKSLVDGSARPGFSSINLPSPSTADPLVQSFASISGMPADQVMPRKPNPLLSLRDKKPPLPQW